MANIVDALILGGGPAGLAAASGLARQLHTAIVFNHGTYRNGRAKHMHNVLGWDHQNPADFRAKAKEDLLSRYPTISFSNAEIQSVKKLDSGRFEAVDVDGKSYLGRKLVLANGIRDTMPETPGFSELWGRSIFHCLFCHGFEERGAKSASVFASGFMATNPAFIIPAARMVGRLADNVNIYTDGNEKLGAEVREALKNTDKYKVINQKVKGLAKDLEFEGDAGLLVTLEDGTVNKEAFMANVPNFELNGSFAKDLGLEISPMGHIDAKPPMFMTNVDGVFAAGDCATMMKAVSAAAYMGSCAAAGIAHMVQAEMDVE